ncbi:hypothetical protein MLD38_015330 [Melastoma candidum]|uniref:Uncharacterized protein n=1 Tax=Melastoma candidum TaxID=119954 RepID=A0ACB9RP79_9MYRT|nr:hypothetical protein MLD38_015330 [Melastoma candidum]
MMKLRCLVQVVLLCHHLARSCGEIVFQLNQGQQLRDWEHLLSPSGIFKLGFFSPSSSSYSYLGIWYSKLPHNPEAIWVANPSNPILNSSGVLTLDGDGRLKIEQNGNETIVVSTNPVATVGNTTLNLLDDGNLLLRGVNPDGSEGAILWQSFDYPTNTLLPGMRLGRNLKSGKNWTLVSWLSDRDPAPGAFRLGVDPGSIDQIVVWRRDEVYWTSGEWSNGEFRSAPELPHGGGAYQFSFVTDEEGGKYFTVSERNSSMITRWELNLWGQIIQATLAADGQTWKYSTTSSCNSSGNDSGAVCIDQKPSHCRNNSELFVQMRGYYNSGELLYSDHNSSLTISDCHSLCWNNCSCVAFGSLFTDGTGCEFWNKGGMFIANDNFDVLYVLSLATGPGEEMGRSGGRSTKNLRRLWYIWLIAGTVPGLLAGLAYLLYSRKRNQRIEQLGGYRSQRNQSMRLLEMNPQIVRLHKFRGISKSRRTRTKDSDFLLYSFEEIDAATDCFSHTNKLGEGGFGPVYKGMLLDGQEIAVKRLSRNSGQGHEEFVNEITLIAELQHTNLVRLLGCCVQADEKMLIYEYMPNKSLDSFLFDSDKRKLLDWKRRLCIIEGVAQGLLYLHRYSRLKVIHRDLKASNILLDKDMLPKISDFGMARIFGQNESRANTNRVVGTYGYMSPEYAMKGIFSVKSDVFSFGVLLLEVVTGRRNGVFTSSSPISLIEQTWDAWSNGNILALTDPTLGSSCPGNELVRIIHVGLLCVQENPADRPTMSTVIGMITNDNTVLPDPKQAAYCIGKSESGESSSGGNPTLHSVNGLSISVVEAR